jgi:hypothetical protein
MTLVIAAREVFKKSRRSILLVYGLLLAFLYSIEKQEICKWRILHFVTLSARMNGEEEKMSR